MSDMLRKKYEFCSNLNRNAAKKALKQLEIARELEMQGNKEESKRMVEDLAEWLEKQVLTVTDQTSQMQDLTKQEHTGACLKLSQRGEVFAQGSRVYMRVICQDEREYYLAISYEYSVMKERYEDARFRELIWEEFYSDNAFVCSIYEKETDTFVGYCSIKDLTKKDWELAIELKSDACNKGYGSEALTLFVEQVYRVTGERYFRACVELDNHTSQRMMRKMGATPNCIREFLLHGEEIERFQQQYQWMITDEIRNVAKEFGMKAEDILGYVLEYQLDARTVGKM